MSETKEASSHLEARSHPDTSHHSGQTPADHATAELYHSDGVILLDIGAKGLESGEAPSLKLAKDGHVRSCLLLWRF
jgi:hypothetical protein